GYRPNKSALQAIGVTRERCWKYDWVIEFDSHKAFDELDWTLLLRAVRKHVKERWAVLHCSSRLQAQWKLVAIGKRLEKYGLKLNLQKSAVVYCKDSRRPELHACKQFTFLGYTFRPRGAKNRYGKLFDSFLPAVSLEATKKMLRTIKSWKLSRPIN